MNNLILEDTTLRDGEQSPGIVFPCSVKLKIFDYLVRAGVKWIEAGIPAMGGDELDSLKQMLERKDEAVIIAWNRGIKEDIKFSIDLGFQGIHIGLPTSDIHLKNSIKKDKNWLLSQVTDLIKYSKDRGVFVSISAEDIGRTDIEFLQHYAVVVEEAGADRLRLSDTIGILTPEEYSGRIKKIKEVANIDLQCHAHNDFGLAVANTLSAIQAGVRYFHVTVNGIGERAGMADIVHVIFALKHLYKIDLNLDSKILKELSEYISNITNCFYQPWYPILGKNVFSHESGIHVNGMLQNGSTFEPILPEEIGVERKYVIGKHSGRATLEYFLRKSGFSPDKSALQECLAWVRQEAVRNMSPVSPQRLKNFYLKTFVKQDK